MQKKIIENILVFGLCVAVSGITGCSSSDFTGHSTESGNVSGSSVNSDKPESNGNGGGSIHLSDDGSEVSGDGIQVTDKKITITKGGTYTVDGEVKDGQIYVGAGKEDEVTLEMNGVTLTNTSDKPIHVENAGKLIFTSAGEKENIITAGTGTQSTENKTVKDAVQVSAIYSKDDITFESGSYVITASGDGIHSNDDVKIKGGTLTITCGDDGIHANESVELKDGKLDIKGSYEGLEANQIEISGGEHSVVAQDDGINANGGSDAFGNNPGGGFGGRGDRRQGGKNGQQNGQSDNASQMAARTMETSDDDNDNSNGDDETDEEKIPNLTITGGILYVNSQGDGLDSNGNLTITGGETIVDGPSSDGNGALDSGSENGGIIKIEGGTVLAVGSSRMSEFFDENESSQCSFLHNFDAHFGEGVEIVITDENGKELIRHKTVRSGDSVVFSSGDLQKDKTYKLQAGDNSVDITLSSLSTMSGKESRGMGGFGGGGFRK